MDEDEDEEVPAMPQPTDSASETDDDVMNGSSHCHTRVNGIGRAG